MRLINIHTLKLEEFAGSEVPPYCILSHRWTGNEITYQDFQKGRRKRSAGYRKIVKFCDLVKDELGKHGKLRRTESETANATDVEHAWVDTCCINKDSSAELSEAINSMYAWYERALCCIAYLEDVPSAAAPLQRGPLSAFRHSEWFRRGWTLQELLAPDKIIFCDNVWRPFGWIGHEDPPSGSPRLMNLMTEVSAASGIAKKYLCHDPNHSAPRYLRGSRFGTVSVAERMSWAVGRTTTRIEDEAYSLLGIFGVNMPLLYGEGRNAFERLQQELVKVSNDQSLFAWSGLEDNMGGIFARSPRQFRNSGRVRTGQPCPPYELTNRGLRLTTQYREIPLIKYKGVNRAYPAGTTSFPSNKGIYVPFLQVVSEAVIIRLNCHVDEEVHMTRHRSHHSQASEVGVGPRDVIMALYKYEGAEQWFRGLNDGLGASSAKFDYDNILQALMGEGGWQRERTFFVDAFRRSWALW